jgi:hypothetical protein
MDKRKEYRVRPSLISSAWYAEVRAAFPFRVFGWSRIGDYYDNSKLAEAACRKHAGEGTKYLGRLP